MRPDRLSGALQQFVGENLGEEFVEQTPFDVFQLYNEMTAITPSLYCSLVLIPLLMWKELVNQMEFQLSTIP